MIRTYHFTDKPKLLDLIALNTPKYFAPEETEDYGHYLDHELEDYFVYEQDGKILGAGGINYFAKEELARISWDMVAPAAQGQGIGAQLVKYRIAKIKEQEKWSKIVVRTSQLAFAFYEKMGFALVRKEMDFWAPGLDLYYMEMPIF